MVDLIKLRKQAEFHIKRGDSMTMDPAVVKQLIGDMIEDEDLTSNQADRDFEAEQTEVAKNLNLDSSWPCEIIESDFYKGTILLKMCCDDYKVSSGQYWLSTSQQPAQNQQPFCYMSDSYEIGLFTGQPDNPAYSDFFPVYKEQQKAQDWVEGWRVAFGEAIQIAASVHRNFQYKQTGDEVNSKLLKLVDRFAELKVNPPAECVITDRVAAQSDPYLKAEINRLTECLKKANAQAEKFEREWYLRGDEIESLKSQPAPDVRELVDLLKLIRGKHGCGALTLPAADLDRVDATLAKHGGAS